MMSPGAASMVIDCVDSSAGMAPRLPAAAFQSRGPNPTEDDPADQRQPAEPHAQPQRGLRCAECGGEAAEGDDEAGRPGGEQAVAPQDDPQQPDGASHATGAGTDSRPEDDDRDRCDRPTDRNDDPMRVLPVGLDRQPSGNDDRNPQDHV